ncbi:MAG: DUF742 domain-containing protein [Microthrixaceae bacterium]
MPAESRHGADDEPEEEADFGRRLIRPYAVTKGRTRPTRDIPIETLVRSNTSTVPPGLGAEEREILSLVSEPISVAEIAARRGLVLGVVRVLIADLVQSGMVETSEGWSRPQSSRSSTGAASEAPPAPHTHRELLERVLNGLQSL